MNWWKCGKFPCDGLLIKSVFKTSKVDPLILVVLASLLYFFCFTSFRGSCLQSYKD